MQLSCTTSKIFLIIICLFIINISQIAGAQCNNIDLEFAKMIVTKNASGLGQDREYIENILTGMTDNELEKLKIIIANDINTNTGVVVTPLPVEQRIAYWVINYIDDRLGKLQYDTIFEGIIFDATPFLSGLIYYSLKTSSGELVNNVYSGPHTLFTKEHVVRNNDFVRIFVQHKQYQNDDNAFSIVKLEFLER